MAMERNRNAKAPINPYAGKGNAFQGYNAMPLAFRKNHLTDHNQQRMLLQLAYLDRIPGVTLATVNLMSLFGLHRRWRGAIIGHLALFEMESSVPNRRYAEGLRRLGFGSARATEFFDEHVTADAIHEAVAAVDLAGGLARQQPHGAVQQSYPVPGDQGSRYGTAAQNPPGARRS